MELDEGKIINCVPDRILQSSKIIFATILCHNKTVLDGLNLLASVSKFGIDTTKNRWYRIGIVSIYLVSPIPNTNLNIGLYISN